MKYMGSKNRHAKELQPIILKDRKPNQWYVEPFCGGCNMIDKVEGNRIASDINYYLIELCKALQNGWLPEENIPKEVYDTVKLNIKSFKPHFVGYLGFQLSYGAMWFGSYRKDSIGKRNYSKEAYNNVKKQAPLLKNIEFYNVKYNQLNIPSNSIIYCDPPYENTAKYKGNKGDFDHIKFWQWCREKTLEGHQVFISEYNAPSDFECIWQKEVNNSLTKNTGAKKGIEKLFIYNP